MRAAKVQASLRIRAVSPEPSLLAHTSSESRETFRQKARSLAPLNGWACAVKICHDGMLEDTNSLDGAHSISHALTIQDVHQFLIVIKLEGIITLTVNATSATKQLPGIQLAVPVLCIHCNTTSPKDFSPAIYMYVKHCILILE